MLQKFMLITFTMLLLDIDIVVKPTDQEDKALESKYLRLSYSEVERITDNFQNQIGKGGSGKVYRGRLSDDTEVAVKLLSSSSAEGFNLFQTEASFSIYSCIQVILILS